MTLNLKRSPRFCLSHLSVRISIELQKHFIYITRRSRGIMARVVIKCAANGPNLIELDGTVFAAMCRCGAANTKPYCDGAHAKIGFKAEAKEIIVSE